MGVDLASVFRPGSRVIDIGPTGAAAAARCHAAGLPYLGLVPTNDLDAVRTAAGEFAHRFHELAAASQVVRNNADILVLRRPFTRFLWTAGQPNHCRHVFSESPRPTQAVDTTLAVGASIASRARYLSRHMLGGRKYDLFELPKRRPLGPRHYLSEIIGVSGLIDELASAEVKYAVLRWFENLPDLPPGEDIDMLVADEHVDTVTRILAAEPGTTTVDVYGVTGRPGSDYRGQAYYQPDLATALLDNAVDHASGCRVPSPVHHLHSLAYHALYHKGYASGLASKLAPRSSITEHDYAGTLDGLALAVGTTLPDSLEDVDDHLAGAGWRPSPDALRRLSADNQWLRDRLNEAPVGSPVDSRAVPEPAVFLIRERTLGTAGVDDVLGVLERIGFEVIAVRELDDDARARCAKHTRGGNWGQGPFPVSGGPPVVAVFAAHYGPRTPPAETAARYPRLSNDDVLLAKEEIRRLAETRVAEPQHFNPVHSSDNVVEAWEYVELAMPEEAARLQDELDRRQAAYGTDVPVVATLQLGRRSKVEIVHHRRHRAVRKTFAPPFQQHMEREIKAMRELGPIIPAVAELIDTGPNWFEQVYYSNTLDFGPGDPHPALIPLRTVRRMVGVLDAFNAHGVDLIDVKAENFILDPVHGLKIVDFEFCHRYDGDLPDLAHSYGFVGAPDDFAGDVPVGDLSYRWRWLRFTGLPLDQLLTGTPTSQHLHRTAYRLRRVASVRHRVVRTGRRAGMKAFRQSRRSIITWGQGRAERAFERRERDRSGPESHRVAR